MLIKVHNMITIIKTIKEMHIKIYTCRLLLKYNIHTFKACMIHPVPIFKSSLVPSNPLHLIHIQHSEPASLHIPFHTFQYITYYLPFQH